MRLNPIQIADLTIDVPVFLAPMSGVSDRPFRKMVRKFGVGLVYSEMIASKEMLKAHSATLKMSQTLDDESPMAVQLAGCDPEIMAEAARMNVDRGTSLIDINMGCPVKKIVKNWAGSALMRDELLAGKIMEAVCRAVNVPVTLKMRLGWDEHSINAPKFARMAEDSGIKMLTVHGRTRQQLYTGTADWRAVAAVKEKTSLPVVINGDIVDSATADKSLALSKADGVMVGRGTYGRPWLPAELIQHFQGKVIPEAPQGEHLLSLILEHYQEILSYYGMHQGVRIARKHIAWYTRGLSGSNGFREAFSRENNPKKAEKLLYNLFAAHLDEKRVA